MTARVIVHPGSRSRQALEHSRGAPEPADPGRYYAVDPGEAGREYFPAGVAGMAAALARAAWLSVAAPPQRVLATRPPGGKAPACTDRAEHRFRGGREITSIDTTPGQDQ